MRRKGIIPNRSTGPGLRGVFPGGQADVLVYPGGWITRRGRWGIMETWFRVACSRRLPE